MLKELKLASLKTYDVLSVEGYVERGLALSI
jgi:hypothetical protein